MKFAITFALLFFSAKAAYSQNQIYLENEARNGQVTEITSGKIKYRIPENPGPFYSVPRHKVLLAFNDQGGFLTFDSTDSSLTSASQFLAGALNRRPAKNLLFTNKGGEIECTSITNNNETIDYSVGNKSMKIDKKDVLVIIYSNGKHEMITSDFVLATKTLSKYQTTPGTPAKSVEDVAAKPTTAPAATNPMPVPITTSNQIKVIPVSQTVKSASDKTDMQNKSTSDGLADVNFDEYKIKALEKTSELSSYLKILCNKSTNYDQSNKAIDQACLLFVDENVIVELSSLNNSTISKFKVRDYFKRLKLLKFSRVEIQWANIQYVSKLRKAPDGTYRGVITFEQTFTGFVENKVIYSDKTTKNIEVVLKTYQKASEGKSQILWDVLLSNIKVVETKNS